MSGAISDSNTKDQGRAERCIIHVDMDAFFASVEQRDHPHLRGKPVAVGSAGRRGVVAAASYEAREYGVRSAMPSGLAARKCPDLIFVPARFDVYRSVSRQIRAIFARYSNNVEPLSLDEAYLDVSTGHCRYEALAQCARASSPDDIVHAPDDQTLTDEVSLEVAVRIARQIRASIRAETGLTASAGVSVNKFLAKLASEQNKPDGLCVISAAQAPGWVASLPVRSFHGVGPRTAEKMAALGIVTGADLRGFDRAELKLHFGKFADYLWLAARGIDHRQVRSSRPRKSIGAERTWQEDLRSRKELFDALDHIIELLHERLERYEAGGRTLTLKARYSDFSTITRSVSAKERLSDKDEIADMSRQLLSGLFPLKYGIRLLGLTLSRLEPAGDDSHDDRAAGEKATPLQGKVMLQPDLPLELDSRQQGGR